MISGKRQKSALQNARLEEWKPCGEMLRKKREELGMTLDDVAEMLGADDRGIGRWERAEVIPTTVLFFRWADVLGFDVALEEVT